MSVRLPDQLQRQLNQARIGGCVTDDPRVCGLERVVRIVQEIGGSEVRVIKDVEKFRAELQLNPLREAEILKSGEVHGRKPRPIKAVAPRMACENASSDCRRRCETFGVEGQELPQRICGNTRSRVAAG